MLTMYVDIYLGLALTQEQSTEHNKHQVICLKCKQELLIANSAYF